MSTIITKNSANSGSTPASLVQGELAINVTDNRLFFGSGSGNDVKEFGVTSSYALQALSASYAVSASYEINYETSSSYADFAVSASHALNTDNATSASYASQAGNAAAIDIYSFSSPVDSYLLMSNVIATTGVAVGGDTDLRYNSSTNTLTAVNISATSLTGSLLGTASYATTALSSSYALNATSASYALSSSYALSASYALNALSASHALTASFITASNVYGPYGSNSVISASYAATASSALNAQDILIRVLNQSGNPIAKGLVVHITASGNSSDIPRVITASYENDNNSANTLGITNETIANGAEGFVMTEGVLKGIDTSAFISGQLIYLGATGSIIGIAPVAPLHAVRLGQVVRVQSNNGSIYVRIDNGYELDELHNVLINTSSVSYGDLLMYSSSLWINSKQLSGSYGLTGSLNATSFTGSLLGTASYATQALSSSYALNATTATTASYVLNAVSSSFASTASSVNTLNQNVLITGSLTVGATTAGANENTLILGPAPAGGTGEGGQLLLQAPGGTYTSASMWDNWQNYTRLLRGTNASSDAVVAQFNMHTKQVSFPQYNSPTAFTGTTLVGLLGFDSGGNLLTTTTSSGGGGGGVTITNNVDNYVITATGTANTINGESNMQFNGSSLTITGEITSSGAIRSNANNSMYFRGGDDAEFWDINVANTVGIYGQQDATVASVKLGSGGGTISGKSGNIGIGTINPTSASLTVNGNVWATSFTGSLQGTATTASYVLNAVSASFATLAQTANTASYVVTAQTASYVLNAVSASFATTASYAIQALSASYAPSTPTFPYTGSAIISGSLEVTGSFTVQDSIDAANKILIGSGPIPSSTEDSVNWDSRTLFDSNGNFSVRWGALRTMYDANASQSVDWNNRLLKFDNGLGDYTVNWSSGLLRDTGSNNSVDWQNRITIDTGNKTSIDWQNRQLKNSSGNEVLNWSSGVAITGSLTVSGSSTFTNIGPARFSGSFVVQGDLIPGSPPMIPNIGPYDAIKVDDINSERKLYGSPNQGASSSIDFGNRLLTDATGLNVLSWGSSGHEFTTYKYNDQQIGDSTRNNLYTSGQAVGQILIDSHFDTAVQDNDLVCLGNGGEWVQVNQSFNSSTRMLGIAKNISLQTGSVFIEGDVVVTTSTGYPIVTGANYGIPVYIAEGAGTTMSTSIPTSGYVRILGHCYYNTGGNEWIMKFRPSNEWYVI